MKKWVIGLSAAFAVLALTGVGFSALTATATVNGSATAATVAIEISSYGLGNRPAAPVCFSWPTNPWSPALGNFSLYGENAQKTSISAKASNLTPGVWCGGTLNVTNTGSVPENISAVLEPGAGMCTALGQNDCYDFSGGITGIDPVYEGTLSATNFTTLAPGASFEDWFVVGIPQGSDDGTPAGASFTLVFTASAGY